MALIRESKSFALLLGVANLQVGCCVHKPSIALGEGGGGVSNIPNYIGRFYLTNIYFQESGGTRYLQIVQIHFLQKGKSLHVLG